MLIDKNHFKERFIEKLESTQGVPYEETSLQDKYCALSALVRDYVYKNWAKTNEEYQKKSEKEVYYFSIEFLLGKLLGKNLLNLGIESVCKEALEDLNIPMEDLLDIESDLGLGNGGLGRLAACFLDSMASLSLPGHGCGIRYKYGLFEQKIINGYQVEVPDNWLKDGNIWEIRKADKAVEVRFSGNVEINSADGRIVFIHKDYEPVLAVPYDIPITGYRNNTVNTLRLWSAEALIKDFDYASFNRGDYTKAVEYKHSVEAISEVLYPDDNYYNNKVLRLKQQYFFVSAGLQSIIKRYKKKSGILEDLPEKISIHINDTHPALAIPELMRILLDEEGMGWDEAWKITINTISYTNHTIMPEALEKWPIEIFKSLIPRIYMIVEEIDKRFCREILIRYGENQGVIKDMAVISDGVINMAHLAIVGSCSTNGVAKIHTEILKKQVMKNFYDFYPFKFNNKTNGVTHRTWLLNANPGLSRLITETIGGNWIRHPEDLIELKRFSCDPGFQNKFTEIRKKNKELLAGLIREKNGLAVDPESIFDVQVKRIHEYKRQVLNLFHIMYLYHRIKENPDVDIMPRTFIFAGKAAPGYYMAKQIIKLINTVAVVVNNDKSVSKFIKIVFLENYRVSLAEKIVAAADISEQISTASKEASGTGNMKFMMNGALTIGTLDGANIEIREEVGDENIITFGLTADQVIDYYMKGGYSSWEIYNSDNEIKRILDSLVNGFFSAGSDEFRLLHDSLLYDNDPYFILKDFRDYVEAQGKIDRLLTNREEWTKKCILNTAYSGTFSSDRAVLEYAAGIWKIRPYKGL